MRLLYLFSICILLLFIQTLNAQSGCPGCQTNLPANLPEDTLFLQDIPDGQNGLAYSQDISFRMPKTTTPVYAVDSITPPGLTISKIEIVSVDGLPQGLYWEPSQWTFQTADETDGCIKICGTPTESDSFVLTVTVRATVLFLTQEKSFPMRMYVAPKVSTTDGFSMSNFTGCGSTEVSFENNVPSNGADGFSYVWDFGDNTGFEGENPPAHTYTEPGTYYVSYHATVDTAGYILESVRVLEVECVDQLGVGTPDLYLLVKAPNGTVLFNSSPAVDNTPLPYTFPIGLPLGEGNYSIFVADEDSGLKGSDDDCGTVPFNILSGDTLQAGGLKVILNIQHPVEEIESQDTVIVYPVPIAPVLTAPDGLEACAGSGTVVLVSSYGAGNQWFLNGDPIDEANEFLYQPEESGIYQVQVSDVNGCTAISPAAAVSIYELPGSPAFYNYNNSLRLFDTLALPENYGLQWYNGAEALPGETGFWYCAMQSGTYGLEVTDLTTGCTNFFSQLVVYNPNFDCTIGTKDLNTLSMAIFPNPAHERLQVRFAEPVSGDGVLRMWDATGRLVQSFAVTSGTSVLDVDCSRLPAGMYALEIMTATGKGSVKVVVE
ncbi:MAG: T9SS type A sorting domain-containing protein [Bacteroidetes bacterium]|nr:T9SS type A sorting domain-containing protein [Bacteroidota bacterium]